MRPIDGPQTAEIVVDGRPSINFCSNNYLGLADHPALIAAARDAMEREGFGAGASRLIVGNLTAHRRLEDHIATWKRTDAALLFNSGYHANVGVVSALAGPEDAIYSDALNHASLIDGSRLSRATVHVYPHLDLGTLAELLQGGRHHRRRLILTDAVFSMDGDQAPLADLVRLARRYDALLLVDEAHAAGVLGEGGAGPTLGLGIDVQIGTFGKALGGFGAYVAASAPLIDYLVQRARSFVFTTALPVPVAAAATAALDLVQGDEGQRRRAALIRVCARFHAGLQKLHLPAPVSPSHIVPILVGDPERTMTLSENLLARGIYVQGIRPPTVSPGTARLRFTLMATHTDDHIDRALAALAELRHHLPPA
ncbi:MAG TPA: 8-amino-7-oxononanoate synthase [Polyangia bacterium]|nr:8-amino-7-oxononanoate synthase [Polyangia bacterium]